MPNIENSKLNTIPIKNLKSKTSVNDSDILVIEDDTTTYKIEASDLLKYIRDTVKDTFVQLSQKGAVDGVVPLDSNLKIDPSYLQFGETTNKIYDGKKGKTLENSINTHKSDTENPHKVTASQVGLDKVENKDSETIRSELTYKNVTDALGYKPETDGSYENATAYTDKKIAELIGGASSTMDTLKEIEDAMKSSADVVEALNEAIGKKANEAEFDSHINDGVIHVTTADKNNITTALNHAKSAHAPSDATKTEGSTINGNIKINDQESVVYEHPLSGVTAGTYREVTVDANGHVTGGNNTTLPITSGGTGATTAAEALVKLGITATTSELNKLDGVLTDSNELNYVHGVKSNIQTQLDSKASESHGTHLPQITKESAGKFVTSDGSNVDWHTLTADDIKDALGYTPGTGSNIVTAVKGDAEEEYKTGNVNITPSSIGLGNVDNTHDNEKAVLSASKLSTARKIGNANFNGTADISLEDIGAMSATDPTGTGSFSLNRKADTTIGNYSFAEGLSGVASGKASHVEGYQSTSEGNYAHAEGISSAKAPCAHSEGQYTIASGNMAHAEGSGTKAIGHVSHAEGADTIAGGNFSHTSGSYTSTTQDCQFAIGFGNDPQDDSIFEVGNGIKSDGTLAIGVEPYGKRNAFRVNQAGQAIAQTGLGIGETVITEDQLKHLSHIGAGDGTTFNGILKSMYNSAVEAATYNAANFVAVAVPAAGSGMNKTVRAGYGFHNAGNNGAFLYLDTTDTVLRMIDTHGVNAVRFAGDEVLLKADTYVKSYGLGLKSHNQAGTAWAPVYASAFTQQSSQKYKKDITELTDDEAQKILMLRPVKYDYINEEDGTDCYGLIAEEVNTVIPYPIVYDSEGNPDGIDYSKFVPYLIKMIQLHDNRITVLEEENEKLKSRLEKLETLFEEK